MKQNLRTQFYKICVICGLLKICANLREMKSYETKPAYCLKSKTALKIMKLNNISRRFELQNSNPLKQILPRISHTRQNFEP